MNLFSVFCFELNGRETIALEMYAEVLRGTWKRLYSTGMAITHTEQRLFLSKGTSSYQVKDVNMRK